MGTSAAELELLDAATASLGALARAIRGASLYEPRHPQVLPFLQSFTRGIAHCCSLREPLVFVVTEDGLTLDGVDLSSAASVPPSLLDRLRQDGVRQLHFWAALDLTAAVTLASALAPYASVTQAPVDSLADRLQWQPIAGTSFVIHRQGSLAADPMTQAQDVWRERVRAPRRVTASAASVWDGRGGRIPWPPPVAEESLSAMQAELAEVDRVGVSTLRLGLILSDIAEHWAGDPRVVELLDVLMAQVDGLLADGLPEEASRLLQPLARWAERAGDEPASVGLRRHVTAFLTAIASAERLEFLLGGIERAALVPEQVVAWFAALPSSELAHALRFAARLDEGEMQEAMIALATALAERAPRALVATLSDGDPNTGALALRACGGVRDLQLQIAMGRAGLARRERQLKQAAAELVRHLDEPALHPGMTALLRHRAPELRLLGLEYVQRFKVTEAASAVEELATAADLRQRPMQERALLGLTFGAIGGDRAAAVARRLLGEDWRYSDPLRTVPWILCLAASGADDAEVSLHWLESQRIAGLNPILTDARNAFQMARLGSAAR